MGEFVHVYNDGGGIRNVNVPEGSLSMATSANNITYDSQGRVATHDGWTISYDAATGRAASRTNGIKTQTFSYDSQGRYTGYTES